MINVLISEPFLEFVQAETVEQTARAALIQQSVSSDLDLTVAIEDDERLHQLNKEFLDIDAPTDVLSFPAGEGEIDPETGLVYLGDIIISYPRASEQAQQAGHPPLDEVRLLIVHGVLHLLGHDHAETEEQEIMWAAQREILRSMGIELS